MPEICASVLPVSFLAERGLNLKIEILVSLSAMLCSDIVGFFALGEL